MVYYCTDQYLSHHGILGQRWGVRRYQNRNGSLTAEGRDHYRVGNKKKLSKYQYKDGSLTEKGKEQYENTKQKVIYSYGGKEHRIGHLQDDLYEKERATAGIKSVDKDTDVIKKGATMQRIATYGEPVDSKRKYVSILYDDNLEYLSASDDLPVGDSDKPAKITLETKKEIKVATLSKTQEEMQKFIGEDSVNKYSDDLIQTYGKKQAKKLLNIYGNVKIKDLKMDTGTLDELVNNDNKTFSKKELKKNKWLTDYLEVSAIVANNASNRIAVGDDDKRSNAFYNHMKKLGYDAFVDPLDSNDGFTDYPLVLLDPQRVVKKTKEEYLDDI